MPEKMKGRRVLASTVIMACPLAEIVSLDDVSPVAAGALDMDADGREDLARELEVAGRDGDRVPRVSEIDRRLDINRRPAPCVNGAGKTRHGRSQDGGDGKQETMAHVEAQFALSATKAPMTPRHSRRHCRSRPAAPLA
jgi:hypothetical protein